MNVNRHIRSSELSKFEYTVIQLAAARGHHLTKGEIEFIVSSAQAMWDALDKVNDSKFDNHPFLGANKVVVDQREIVEFE